MPGKDFLTQEVEPGRTKEDAGNDLDSPTSLFQISIQFDVGLESVMI